MNNTTLGYSLLCLVCLVPLGIGFFLGRLTATIRISLPEPIRNFIERIS